MVEIGGRPIIWHIMKHYARYELKDFLLALGYKGEAIKRYFLDYRSLQETVTVHLSTGEIEFASNNTEDWKVTLVDTGVHSMTGGRLGRMKSLIGTETFMLTYGDGVSDVNLTDLLRFHRSHGKVATITGVRPPARFGDLSLDGDIVSKFVEKPQAGEGWVNGGFMVFEPHVFDYIEGDQTVLERDVLQKLAADRELAAFQHRGFWQSMDTPRDLRLLEKLWDTAKAPWRTWD